MYSTVSYYIFLSRLQAIFIIESMFFSYLIYVPIIYVYVPDEAYWCTPPPIITNGIPDYILSAGNETSFSPNKTVGQKSLLATDLITYNNSFSSTIKDLIIPKTETGKFEGCYMYNISLGDIEVGLLEK